MSRALLSSELFPLETGGHHGNVARARSCWQSPPLNEEGASWRSVLVITERFGFWHYRKSLNQHQNVLKGAPRLSHAQGLFPDLPGELPAPIACSAAAEHLWLCFVRLPLGPQLLLGVLEREQLVL